MAPGPAYAGINDGGPGAVLSGDTSYAQLQIAGPRRHGLTRQDSFA